MIGSVDENNRALLTVSVRPKPKGEATNVDAWVDTAFDGHFVFSLQLIHELELDTLVDAEAILADGSKVVMETYVCYLDWFGEVIPVQVIANEGRFPLLGTALLEQRILKVDYPEKTVVLD